MTQHVPEGWATARVRGLFDCWGGMTPSTSVSSYWGGDVPWISSKDVKAWCIAEGTEFVTRKALAETRLRACRPGSVLVVVRSGILAHTLPVALVSREVVVNQDLKVFDCGDDRLNQWLALYLRAQEREILSRNRKDGTTVQSIRVEEVLDLDLPVPPSREQARIIGTVDSLVARVNGARNRLAKVPGMLKRFRQSVLAAACSGKLTEDWREQHAAPQTSTATVSDAQTQVPADEDLPNISIPSQWAWATTESLCDRKRAITYGVIKLGAPVEAGVPTLRSSDVRPLFIDRTAIKCISRGIADQYQRTYLRGGEVLVTVRGTLGGVAVVPADMAGHNISREVAQLPVTPALVPEFIMYAIASTTSQNWLAERAKGVAYTGINIADLRRLPLPLPSFEEQHEIVRRVKALFNIADAIERRVVAATARADMMTQAVLAKAFSGELVPTEAEVARQEGRDYESSTALLERVQAQRGATATSPGNGRRRRSSGGGRRSRSPDAPNART